MDAFKPPITFTKAKSWASGWQARLATAVVSATVLWVLASHTPDMAHLKEGARTAHDSLFEYLVRRTLCKNSAWLRLGMYACVGVRERLLNVYELIHAAAVGTVHFACAMHQPPVTHALLTLVLLGFLVCVQDQLYGKNQSYLGAGTEAGPAAGVPPPGGQQFRGGAQGGPGHAGRRTI